MQTHHKVIIFLQIITCGILIGFGYTNAIENERILVETKISNMYLRGAAIESPTPEPICKPTPPLVLR